MDDIKPVDDSSTDSAWTDATSENEVSAVNESLSLSELLIPGLPLPNNATGPSPDMAGIEQEPIRASFPPDPVPVTGTSNAASVEIPRQFIGGDLISFDDDLELGQATTENKYANVEKNESYKRMQKELATVVEDSGDEDCSDSETSQEEDDSDDQADEKRRRGSTEDGAVEQSDSAKRDSARLRSSCEEQGALPTVQTKPDSDRRSVGKRAEAMLLEDLLNDLGTLRANVASGELSGTTKANSSSRDNKATKPTFSSVDSDPFKYSKPFTTFYPPAAASKHQPPSNAIQMLPTSFFQDDCNNNLLSGRMNDARWREAQIVTNEAIERIHLSLKNCPTFDEFEADQEIDEVETAQPEGLTTHLMDHQRQALTWLLWRESENPPGGILADDMGLGKTLTMISLVLAQKQAMKASKRTDLTAQMRTARPDLVPSRTTLVVCPASLMGQWKQEIKTRVKGGNLKVLLYHGSNRFEEPSELADYDVIITTYDTVRSEVVLEDEKGSEDITKTDDESDSDNCDKRGKKKTTSKKDKQKRLEPGPLSQLFYERIILDEAHLIKNHMSKRAKACCRLVALSRWAVTGTPIQNKLLEFYSLLKFLRCSPFDELRVWKQWIEDNKSKRADQRLQALVKCLLLRRMKSDINREIGKPIVDLPPKQIETYSLVLQADERKVYDQFFKTFQKYVKQYVKSQADKGRELIEISSGRSTHEQLGYRNPFKLNGESNASVQTRKMSDILVMLLRLRQACCHLSLMKSAVDFDALKQDCGLESTVEANLRELSLNSDQVAESGWPEEMFEADYVSTKLGELLRLVRSIVSIPDKEGRRQKIVIVSQWVTLLNIVGDHLRQAGIHYTSITSEVDIQERTPRAERFNRVGGTQVMLLAMGVGGVGLNLVGGNHLVLLDLHWNPAVEQQAADRIYRLGQTRNVFVHRLICKDTIEERVLELQKQKLDRADNVLSGAGSKNLNKLTIADLKTLFLLDVPTKKAPRPVVKVASNSNIAIAATLFPPRRIPELRYDEGIAANGQASDGEAGEVAEDGSESEASEPEEDGAEPSDSEGKGESEGQKQESD